MTEPNRITRAILTANHAADIARLSAVELDAVRRQADDLVATIANEYVRRRLRALARQNMKGRL